MKFLVFLASLASVCMTMTFLNPVQAAQPASEVVALRYIPDTPYLPRYTGCSPHFVRALRSVSHITGVRGFGTVMEAKESKEQVSQWYKRALTLYGWQVTVLPGSVEGVQIDKGTTCTVKVQDSAEPGYRTTVILDYNFMKNNENEHVANTVPESTVQ